MQWSDAAAVHRKGFAPPAQLQNPAIYDTDTTSMILQNQISKVEAYTIALNNLTQLQLTQDPAWLFTMAAQLGGYKYII